MLRQEKEKQHICFWISFHHFLCVALTCFEPNHKMPQSKQRVCRLLFLLWHLHVLVPVFADFFSKRECHIGKNKCWKEKKADIVHFVRTVAVQTIFPCFKEIHFFFNSSQWTHVVIYDLLRYCFKTFSNMDTNDIAAYILKVGETFTDKTSNLKFESKKIQRIRESKIKKKKLQSKCALFWLMFLLISNASNRL